MASSWGISWAKAWGNSWGSILQGGGSGSSKAKNRGFANERARQIVSLKPVEEVTQNIEVKKEEPVNVNFQKELILGQELILESASILERIDQLESRLLAKQITQEEYEKFLAEEEDELAVVLMAMDLESYVVMTL